MLSEYRRKVKNWIIENKADLFVTAIIFLVGLASFGLGRLSVLWLKKEPIVIENYELRSTNYGAENKQKETEKTAVVSEAIKGRYVASKSGTRYHFPWCSGAQRIKEDNKIWFETKEEAEKAGYKPALNCPDL